LLLLFFYLDLANNILFLFFTGQFFSQWYLCWMNPILSVRPTSMPRSCIADGRILGVLIKNMRTLSENRFEGFSV
jgi:hypothetical protein